MKTTPNIRQPRPATEKFFGQRWLADMVDMARGDRWHTGPDGLVTVVGPTGLAPALAALIGGMNQGRAVGAM